MSRSTVVVETGGIGGAAAYLAQNASPQLLLIETVASGDALFSELETLADVVNPDTKVVLIGQQNDIALYKRLIGLGVSEYLCGPVTTERLIATIEGIFSDASDASLGRVIAVIGARGGVGASKIAANTAYCLGQAFREQVILMDLDLSFGTSTLELNLPQKQSIVDALSQPGRLDDVLMERIMLKYDDHLSVVPAPSSLDRTFDISPESLEVLMALVRKMAAFVVLDLPHLWVPWINQALLDANEVVVVACPDLANLRDAKNLFDTLGAKRGVDAPTRLVFNRVGEYRKTELTAKDFEETTKAKPAAIFPFDAVLFGTAMNDGKTAVEANKGGKMAKEFARFAQVVSGRIPASAAKAKKKGSESLLVRLGLAR